MMQVERILEINKMHTFPNEIAEAVRESLVPGQA